MNLFYKSYVKRLTYRGTGATVYIQQGARRTPAMDGIQWETGETFYRKVEEKVT